MMNPMHAFRRSFLLRWMLASILGWTLGLFVAAWSLVTPVICLSGALAGVIVGLAQWLVLRPAYAVPRDWVLWSVAGGVLGAVPALMMGALVVLGAGVAAAGFGGAFGLALGIGQWVALRRPARAGGWLLANAAGGAACGLLSVTPFVGGLPLGLLVGSALFGALTGWALQRLLERRPPVNDV